MTSPTRESIRTAFKTILDDAELGVTVYDREPDPGFDMNSIVISIITGLNEGAGLGSGNFHEFWRIQLSIFATDPITCGELAVKVSNAILTAASTFASTYGIGKVTKVTDIDMGRQDPNIHEFQIVQDYKFETNLDFS